MPLDIQFLLESLTNVPITNSEAWDAAQTNGKDAIQENPDRVADTVDSSVEPDDYDRDDDGNINDPRLSFNSADAWIFFAFADYSIIQQGGIHAHITSAVKRTWEEGEESAAFIYDENGFVSDEKKYVEDVFDTNGVWWWWLNGNEKKPNIRNAIPGVLVGRLWSSHNVISFWNDQGDVLHQWKNVERMFRNFPNKLGDLKKYQVDWVNREEGDPFGSAEEISMTNSARPEPEDERQTNFFVKLFDAPEKVKKMSTEKLNYIRNKMHVLDPGVKAQVMKATGNTLYNKAGELADALGMSVAEFNSLWHLDETRQLAESPDWVQGGDAPEKKEGTLKWYYGDNWAFFAFKDYSMVSAKRTHEAMLKAAKETWEDKEMTTAIMLEAAVRVSNEKAFLKDLFTEGGQLNHWVKHEKQDDIRVDYDEVICGRLWTDRKIISFWNDNDDVIHHWDYVEKMFESFSPKLGSLKKYRIDWITRFNSTDAFGTADAVAQERKKMAPHVEPVDPKQLDFFTKLIKTPEKLDRLSDEQLKKVRGVLHVMPPEVKSQVMKQLGSELKNKSDAIANKLGMSAVELNSLMRVDESPDRIQADVLHGIEDRMEKRGIEGVSFRNLTTTHYDNVDAVPFFIDPDLGATIYCPPVSKPKMTHPDMGAQIMAYSNSPSGFELLPSNNYVGYGFDAKEGTEPLPNVTEAPVFIAQAKSEEQLKDYLDKLADRLPLDGDVPRHSIRFMQGRLWMKRHIISFWWSKERTMPYFEMVEQFLVGLKLDPTKMFYEFIDSKHLYDYDEINFDTISTRAKAEMLQLMAQQHLNPAAKKKLAGLQRWVQRTDPGFDFQAQRDAALPALQEIYVSSTGELGKKKDRAIKEFFSMIPNSPDLSIDLDPHGGSKDALNVASLFIKKEARWKGLGTKVMKALCKVADSYDLPVELEVGGKDSNASFLVPWYEGYGFTWQGGYMRREPNTSRS